MVCHVGVLPTDLLEALSGQLETMESGGQPMTREGYRFLRLPHPRTGLPSLFLPYEVSGKSVILEVQVVSPPNRRSWFMSDEVLEDGKLLIMTPIDPAFLLIPILRVLSPDGDGTFRPIDDLLEDAAAKLRDDTAGRTAQIPANDVTSLSSLQCIRTSMRYVCEVKEVTAEIAVYRYSATCVQDYLKGKATRLSGQHISEMSRTITRNFARDGLLDEGKETVLAVARLRSACDLLSQYLPKDIFEQLLSSYDFSLLQEHMRVLREEAMALASANMNTVEARESKSSRDNDTSDDKKRKAPKASTGVEKLKKANVKGMAKLSTFFQKK